MKTFALLAGLALATSLILTNCTQTEKQRQIPQMLRRNPPPRLLKKPWWNAAPTL